MALQTSDRAVATPVKWTIRKSQGSGRHFGSPEQTTCRTERRTLRAASPRPGNHQSMARLTSHGTFELMPCKNRLVSSHQGAASFQLSGHPPQITKPSAYFRASSSSMRQYSGGR